jgi:hypothetical protein
MPNLETDLLLKANIELLNNTNWDTWSFMMEQYLIINELWDIVNGTETEPTDAKGKAEFLWKQRSARAHITLHISPLQLSTVQLETDPKKIWDELQRLNRPTRMALRRELANMKKDPRVPMSKWVTSVRDLARQIKELNGDVPDEQIIVILTNSLPASYAPLVVQLDSMEENSQTLSHVITRLIGEERRQTGGKGRAATAKRRYRDRSEVTCYGYKEKGHYRSECHQKNPEKPKRPGAGMLY